MAEMVICPSGDDPEVIRLTEDLPHEYANEGASDNEAYPWELVLEDGSRCYPVGGATLVVGDMRLNFECSGGLSLYGAIDQTEPLWTVLALREGETDARPVRIATART